MLAGKHDRADIMTQSWKAPRTGGPWFRHQAWIGLSAGVSSPAAARSWARPPRSMHSALGEVELLPTQGHSLNRAQTMPISNQHHS